MEAPRPQKRGDEIWNHDSVAYYRPGLLAADIDDRAATITVTERHTFHMPQIPWDPSTGSRRRRHAGIEAL